MEVASNFVDYIQMKMDESSSEIVTDICQHLMKFSIEGMLLLYGKQLHNVCQPVFTLRSMNFIDAIYKICLYIPVSMLHFHHIC